MSLKLEATPVVLKDVTKRFGKICAVDRVSLEIEPGELVTLLGPSGCGKTTTLRIVAGLETATEGKVFIGVAEVTQLPPNARDVTMMFQSYALFPHLSVFENVAYGLRVLKRPATEVKQAVREVLDLVGMPGMEGRSPSALSGGQQQRVAVARSLVNDPLMILADEPTGNLDSKTGAEVLDLITRLNEVGKTIILVTHDDKVAARAHRIVRMRDGLIDQDITRPEAGRGVPGTASAGAASI